MVGTLSLATGSVIQEVQPPLPPKKEEVHSLQTSPIQRGSGWTMVM